MRVLFATPYRAHTHPALLDGAMGLRDAAVAAATSAGYAVDVALYRDEGGPPQSQPYAGNARARNALLAAHLTPEHDLVLWVDADLVRYPADIIPRLDEVRDGGVAAPFVYLDKEAPGRFYDTAGFIEFSGQHTPIWPPHFTQPGPVVSLLSVGCCYLIPADVYRSGAVYAPAPPHVEHWPVMRHAAAMGLPIVADRRIEAFHAYLPDYGERWHDGRQ
jgi:hypothetical protein